MLILERMIYQRDREDRYGNANWKVGDLVLTLLKQSWVITEIPSEYPSSCMNGGIRGMLSGNICAHACVCICGIFSS